MPKGGRNNRIFQGGPKPVLHALKREADPEAEAKVEELLGIEDEGNISFFDEDTVDACKETEEKKVLLQDECPFEDFFAEEPASKESPFSVSEEPRSLLGVPGKNLRMIPVDLIDPNPLAPREVYTPEMIKARGDALKKQGQHDPIHVIPNPEKEGRYIIVDGWTRTQACIEHGVLRELYAEVHENLSLQDAAWYGFHQNEEREQHCDFDRATFFEKMISTGMRAKAVASKVGLSESTLAQYRAFSKLSEDILDIVKRHPKRFTAYPAYHILRVMDRASHKDALKLAAEFAENNQTIAWLINRANSLIEPSRKKKSKPGTNVRYRNGFYKNSQDKVSLTLELQGDKKAEFTRRLEELLEEFADAGVDEGVEEDNDE